MDAITNLPYQGKPTRASAFVGKHRILTQNIGKLVFYTNSPPNHYTEKVEHVDIKVNQQRALTIDAALVRIMKARKELQHRVQTIFIL